MLRIVRITISTLFILSVCITCFGQESFMKAKDASGGEAHSLVLMSNASLYATGDNGTGQLGVGDYSNYNMLVRVHGGEMGTQYLDNIIDFDAGWKHTLAVTASNLCLAWGNDGVGELGTGPGDGSSTEPNKVWGNTTGTQKLQNIVAVSAGRSGQHSLAVEATTGYVWAWGLNGDGQCGNPTSGTQLPVGSQFDTPVKVRTGPTTYLTGIVKVEAGVSHSLALGGDHRVWTWGSGYQSGSFATEVKDSLGNSLPPINAIAACYESIALDSGGYVWRWKNAAPKKVPGGRMGGQYLHNIVAIGQGYNYFLALDSAGNIWAWGEYNFAPQYGNDNESGGTFPVKVHDGEMNTPSGFLENIVAIDGGFSHGLAVDRMGGCWAWGEGDYGELGQGQMQSSSSPVRMLTNPSGLTACSVSITETHSDGCVMPADLLQSPLINYTITYSNTITNTQDPNYVGTLHSARVVAYLPRELDPDLDLLGGGTYDTTARTVTWTISQLDPGHSGTVIFSATVNSFAKPGVAVRNVAQFEFDPWAVQASVNTPICYYGGPFIYVDPNATGLNNGTAWTDAFTDISEAVASANLYGSGAQVWMKKGIYRQATALTPISGVSIYGSFAGRESSLDQRIIDPNSSIITGDTNDDGFAETATLLSLNGVTDVRIDGIAFTMSGSSGISIQNATGSNIVIANCTFSSNSGYYGGLYANSADPCVMNCHFASNDKGIYAETTIDWVNGTTLEIDGCSFSGNSSYGIYLSDAGAYIDNCEIGPNNDTGISCYDYGVEITESWIHDNSTKGVYCTQGATASLADCTLAGNWTGVQAETYADLTLNRCLISGSSDIGVSAGLSCSVAIYNNIIKNSGSHGIYLTGTNTATVTNCWIVNNGGYGIDLYNLHMPPTIRNNTIAHNGSGGIYRYETGHDPDILNTIFWQNGTGGTVDTVGTFGNVTYSRTSTTRSGAGNMTYDPCFADPCNGDYHLKAESQCIDKGQTVADCYSEHDIDDNPRVRDGDYIGPPAVDMGAHEYYQSLADLNHDRRVNFKDYAILMWSWGKSTGQPGWNGDCDFVPDNSINYKDLACMLEDWLWQGDVPNLPGCDLTLLPQQQQQQSMMMSVSGNSGASMASLSRAPMSLSAAAENVEPVSPSLMAQQLQENIAFLYEAAQESPDDANSIYEFISKLEQSLNELSTDQ